MLPLSQLSKPGAPTVFGFLVLRISDLSGRGQRCCAERTFNTVPFQDTLYDLGEGVTQTTEYALGTISQADGVWQPNL
jgi:hypothetical protein